MKILVLAPSTYPDEGGGVQRHVFDSSHALKKKGHEITILTKQTAEGQAREELIEGLKFIRFEAGKAKTGLLDELAQVKSARQALNQMNGFDLALVHSPHLASALRQSRLGRLPFIYVFHAPIKEEFSLDAHYFSYPSYDPKRYLKKFYLWAWLGLNHRAEKNAVNQARKVICLSEFMKSRLERIHGVRRAVVVPGGVDTERFKPFDRKTARKELAIEGPQKIVLTVRRLVSRMGLKELVKAMEKVDGRLLIAGQGPLKPELERLMAEKNLQGKVKLLGFVPDEKLPKLYAAADLFVLPTQKLEGFGIATIEALSCGRAVLGTPVGGTVEILARFDPQLLFEGLGQEKLAEKINWFLKQESSFVKEVEKKSRRYVLENYSWKKIGSEIESECLKVIS